MENKSQIILASLYLREASNQILEIEPELSLSLLKTSAALLDKYSVDEPEVKSFEDLSDEIAKGS